MASVVKFILLSVVLGTSIECDIRFQFCAMGCGLIRIHQTNPDTKPSAGISLPGVAKKSKIARTVQS